MYKSINDALYIINLYCMYSIAIEGLVTCLKGTSLLICLL